MKGKFVILMLCMILLVGTVSAAQWDNKITYKPGSNGKVDLKVDFDNLFGLGKNLGSAEIKSHKSIEEVKRISVGKDKVVMWYDFDWKEIENNALGEVTFKNMRNDQIIEKNYSFVYWGEDTRDVYGETNCQNAWGNGTEYNCDWTVVGSESYDTWLPYETTGLPKGKITIGLMTDVSSGEWTDAVWTIVGKKVSKHLSFSGAGEQANDIVNLDTNVQDLKIKLKVITQGVITQVRLGSGDSSGSTSNVSIFQNNVRLAYSSQASWKFDTAPYAIFGLSNYSDSVNSTVDGGTFYILINKTAGASMGSDDSATEFNGTLFEYASQSIPGKHSGQAGVPVFIFNETVLTVVPKITNFFPQNNSQIGFGVLNVSGDVDGQGGLTNVSIFVNGAFNQSNSSGFDAKYNFDLVLPDGTHDIIWTMNNSAGGNKTLQRFNITPEITTHFPENITYNFTKPVQFNYTSSPIANECWFSTDSGTTNSSPITCNSANFTVSASSVNVGLNTWHIWANGTKGTLGKVNISFTFNEFAQNAVFYNSSTFETKIESFIINITTNGTAPTNAILTHNGTNTTGTIVNTAGNNFNLSATKSIPIGTGNKTWSYFFGLSGLTQQTTTNQQSVAATLFGACNATIGVPYLNFTFRNETLAQENITATISSTWVYSLSPLADISKSLIFTNATENANYTFCGTPANQPINVNVNLTYNNDISQQRSFSLTTILSNVTTNQVLFLLPTALGIFSPFRTVTITGDTLTDVRAVITRLVGGLPIDISSGFTDGSGFITFFLNPDVTYTGVFSKSGVADNTFSFVPTTDTRTVIMGQEASAIGNGSTIARGLNYNITPVNGTLSNNTNINFTLFASSNETITLMSLNITNGTNTQLLFVNATSSGLISGIFNTGNQTRLIGTYIIQTATETITVKKIYVIVIKFEGAYSIYRQGTLFTTYGFSDFIRIMMVIFFMTAVMIFLTRREVIDTSESKVIVATLLVWAFSIIGWLDTGLVSSTSSTGINRLSQLSNQFGIAILSTGIAIFFILRRVFIRRP